MGKPRLHFAIMVTTPDTQAVMPIDIYLRIPIEDLRHARVSLVPYQEPVGRFRWLRGKRGPAA